MHREISVNSSFFKRTVKPFELTSRFIVFSRVRVLSQGEFFKLFTGGQIMERTSRIISKYGSSPNILSEELHAALYGDTAPKTKKEKRRKQQMQTLPLSQRK